MYVVLVNGKLAVNATMNLFSLFVISNQKQVTRVSPLGTPYNPLRALGAPKIKNIDQARGPSAAARQAKGAECCGKAV